MRSVGVEEEFLLVDPYTGRPRPVAAQLLGQQADTGLADPDEGECEDEVESELQLQQIETSTRPCTSFEELVDDVRRARAHASDVAGRHGARIAALGTSPIPVQARVHPARRYQRMARRFGMVGQEQLSCGCHVHVQVDSDAEAVGVLNHVRPWLSVLLAVSANSPYWQGEDSAYASYRSQVWSRWPSAGPTALFDDPDDYHNTVRAMIETGTILDEGMVYFDARLSRQYPTVELRVADVCTYAQDGALIAILSRALIDTAARDWAAGVPAASVRTELIRLGMWRASRSGLDTELIDPLTQRPVPAETVIGTFLAHIQDSLVETGDDTAARELLTELMNRGNGARLQRADLDRTGQLCEVVALAAQRTHPG